MPIEAQDDLGFAGRVCVVTGGASGIGRSVVLALAVRGARIAILDRNETGAQLTLQAVQAAGAEGLAVACDVADQASVEAACSAVRDRFGDAQILVNNAGIIRPGGLGELSLADWNLLLSVNLTGYFLCAQAFGRAMRANRDGAIVHVSSVCATVPLPLSGAYSVAKAGVTMLSRLLALEWAADGVRSNVVLPGLIHTEMTEAVYSQPGMTGRRAAIVPAQRIGRPEDIAQMILFLASPKSSYVTGAEVSVDGAFRDNLMKIVPSAGGHVTLPGLKEKAEA